MSRSYSRNQCAKLRGSFPEAVTTTIFISNLHCPSCVDSIRESLSALQPAPKFISHSIVSHSVVLRHESSLAVDDISASLEAAGFEIHSIFQDQPADSAAVEVRHPREHDQEWQNSLEQAVSRWNRSHVVSRASKDPDMHKRQRHTEQCEQCKAEAGAEKINLDQPTNNALLYPLADDFIVTDTPPASALYKATLAISGMTCSSCVSSITHAVQELPWVRSVDVNLLTASGTIVFEGKHRVSELVSTVEDAGFDVSLGRLDQVHNILASQPKQKSDKWRATYAIGGMTCSSCVGNVTNALETHTWIEKVDVNLVSNSAMVIFSNKSHLPEIQESIEDAGYDATLDNVVSMDGPENGSLERSIAIRINGMYCHHCPPRITRELAEKYGENYTFELVEPSLSEKVPIVNIRYVPDLPDFTVRNIFQTIMNIDSSFRPSVYHPPTIEDRAREMQARERRRILFRLVLSVVIAIPTFLLGIVFMSLVKPQNPVRQYIEQPMWAGNVPRVSWALFILSTPVYFFAADTFHRRAIKEIRALWRPGSRTPILRRFYRFGSMNMLMSLGTSVAYFASVVELALAATWNSQGDMHDSYFDSVVFLTMFLLIGRFLEAYSKAKTGDAVTSLGKLRPKDAILVTTGGDQVIATDLLEIGDAVRVPHGASPPFDGTVIEGSTKFDESSLTGESRPISKDPSDTVYSGTINKGPPIKVKITSVSGTSMLDQIINVVREGQAHRAPVERVADMITSHFVPFVVLVAIVTWVTWLLLGTTGAIPKSWRGGNDGSGGWALWSLRFAIAVFVIACPCGIGLAAPTALFVGGGLAAKHGILVKGGGEAFQEASSLDCIVFDKTGTLTQGGGPAVTEHTIAGSQDRSNILGIVKALEENSSHPIARAIVAFCNSQLQQSPVVIGVDEVPGKGLKGTFKVRDQEIVAIIGNEAFMSDHHVPIQADRAAMLQTWKTRGESVALAALLVNNPPRDSSPSPTAEGTPFSSEYIDALNKKSWELAAMFSIADPLRPEAPGVIAALQKKGIEIWMLSGDNQTTANAVGSQVGIPASNIIAGVLPDQKAEKIKYLQSSLTKNRKTSLFNIPFLSNLRRRQPKRATIAMVGDGINDAPALSTADLSIAIGSGSDVALSSSSFILINSHLSSLLTLLSLSRVVFRRVYLNFGWALVYNLIAMPVAAGVLYPIKHIRLDPVWASLAMALSSVSVVSSSLALRSRVPGLGFRVKKGEGAAGV
ncbi:heavy metal translocatin [Lojkania enalia]|uniref:Heavy metal translocatin n=1 Tax=Lojkania enalia TaxID=147567 RepID=A0A9P4NC54_9PLEO|nr:heavy metal translocatin [Didymosphaeria enalia]